MVKVFSTEDIRKMEELTCEQKQITVRELMYQAGYVLAKDFLSRVMPLIKEEILVIAGTGNNGGDALVVFQELKQNGYNVKLAIIGDVERGSETFKFYVKMLPEHLELITMENIDKAVRKSKFIVDGIFGIGLNRDVSGDYKYLVKLINQARKTVYSLDIPSGINADSGLVMGLAIKAKFTGVVGKYKLGNFLNDALDYHGEIKLLDIGLLEGYSDIYYLDYTDVDLTKERFHNSYKYSYGHLACIGSSSMPGAINLSAKAALRSGVGLVEVFLDQDITRFNEEIIYSNLAKDTDFSKYDVVIFGPGIKEIGPLHQQAFDQLIKENKKVIVDAGGLKCLDLNKKYNNIIITPHLKELTDILKLDMETLRKDPITQLRQLAKKGIITLLKGATTIIQEQRYTYLMQAKNHGLATAGTGDVLCGIIASFLVNDTSVNSLVKGASTQMRAADL
ncbi:MAG: NAD(P)H-hydrate dehydratase, partial [Candidatus Izemoplasmatales bacterium]|nr:NAD(P)H-hydrate dehydratase [Candidatus Izemoplasmatales bacterium]